MSGTDDEGIQRHTLGLPPQTILTSLSLTNVIAAQMTKATGEDLDYFFPAVQLTATPKFRQDNDTYKYFENLYLLSLKG
jgi:hypothetical protein